MIEQIKQRIRDAMAKFWISLAALLTGIGVLLTARAARGAPVGETEGANIGPGVEGIGPVPMGASPAGLRNKNPFNIKFRTTIQWQGQIGTDGTFVVFNTSLNGIRAGMINIHTKMTRDGLNTVRKIISRLSPAVENPTEAFIQFVAGRMNVAADQPITWRPYIIAMSKAIIQFENGEQPFSDDTLNEALQATGRV
jgi:hypothetical protein